MTWESVFQQVYKIHSHLIPELESSPVRWPIERPSLVKAAWQLFSRHMIQNFTFSAPFLHTSVFHFKVTVKVKFYWRPMLLSTSKPVDLRILAVCSFLLWNFSYTGHALIFTRHAIRGSHREWHLFRERSYFCCRLRSNVRKSLKRRKGDQGRSYQARQTPTIFQIWIPSLGLLHLTLWFSSTLSCNLSGLNVRKRLNRIQIGWKNGFVAKQGMLSDVHRGQTRLGSLYLCSFDHNHDLSFQR